jgi:hypothetical protein
MRFVSLVLWVGVFLFGAGGGHAQTVDAPALAMAFRYPAEKLKIEDVTSKLQRKHGENIRRAVYVTGEGHTFAPITIVFGRLGTLLTPQRQARIDEALRVRPAGGDAPVVKRSIVGGVTCYSGIGVFGPGGSEELAVAAVPSRDMDIQVKVTIPFETPLKVDAATQAYSALISDDALLEGAILAVMHGIVERELKAEPAAQGRRPR